MNRNELEAAAEERLFDVMLGEVAREPVGEVHGVARSPRWLAAAIVLLGLAVVAGVVLTSRATPSTAVAPQEPAPLPPVVNVRGMAELLKADRKIENLSCAIEGPDFGVLKEFTSLRALRVEQDHNIPHPTLVQSAWSLAPIAGCTKLESLSVGPLARFTAVELAPIAALPNLRSLELSGAEKDVDADLAAVLGKLPLRSLVLQAVSILPDGLRAISELPLLERLELRDCTGLEKCDLKHLYRLRQLRALTLRGFGAREVQLPIPTRLGDQPIWLQQLPIPTFTTTLGTDQPISIQLPEITHGRTHGEITAQWTKGLAGALPGLRELDFADSRIDDDVLAALPRALTFLGLQATRGYGANGIAAVGELPQLQGLACGGPALTRNEQDRVPLASWLPLLDAKKLRRFEFAGVVTAELDRALRQQTELRELCLRPLSIGNGPVRVSDWRATWVGSEVLEGPFQSLRDLPHLERIEVFGAGEAFVAALRSAVPDRVRIVTLAR